MTKGERLYKDMKALGKIEGLDMDNGQGGSNIEQLRRIKILGQEKHISRRSKLMNLIGCI